MKALSLSFWELTPDPAPALPVALVFPFAGGNAHSVREWAERLPGYRTIAVQYPGRGARTTEPFAESIEKLGAALADEYLDLLKEPPALLLGHSLGSLVALETALVLEERGMPAGALVVSAASPPGTRASGAGPLSEALHGRPMHLLDDDVLADALVEAGGLPSEILGEPELLALALPVVRHDFQLGWDYPYQPGRSVLCPLFAIGGTDDLAVPAEALGSWRSLAAGPFSTRTWPGGHFYFRAEVPGLVDLVRPGRSGAPEAASAMPKKQTGPEARETMESGVLEAVLAVWSELLPTASVTTQTRFFESGGTSIAAMRACSKLSARLGVRVPVKILLTQGRLDEFAVEVSELWRAAR
ncbi:alpha/beta fold hydrolase [Streptomyces sp. LN699]|uniref:alpha/beta fold hydrolase n=1 Tax=Streptomyces sp. LN699 TaxID=3112981 RepID=UPI003719F82C